MALDHDFYLTSGATSLGFNKKITNETPEERATAQFRKEQFDSTPTVGDQSLSGWWTRGQLSFHKGAGVDYYEVLDGDPIFNRFTDSQGVEVFTPGEVSLLREGFDAGSAAVDAVPVSLAGGGGCYALTATGVEYVATGAATAVGTSNSGTPYGITTDGDVYYVVNGTLIERQAASPAQRTNYVTNPSFEVDATGWTGGGGAGSAGRSITVSRYGTYSLRKPDASGTGAWVETTVSGLTAGTTYAVKVWVYCDSTSDYDLLIDGAPIDTTTSTDYWHQLAGTFVAGAASVTLRIHRTGGTLYRDFYTDAVILTEAPYAGDYFDGASSGAVWTGAPHASTSTYVTPSSDPSVALWTSTDSTWSDVFYAKGRLFGVDADGKWYQLPVTGGTTIQGDAFWSSGRQGVNWQVADGPSSMYVSDGHSIYAISIETNGLVPTLGVPTTVATVPAGETIATIGYYLGHVVLCTSAGVRLALVRDDASLLMGPLVIEGDFSASRRIGSYGNKVFVVGRPDTRGGDSVACAIDLSQPVPGSDLVYAWSPGFTVTEMASSASGAVADGTGRLWAWAGGVLLGAEVDDLGQSGYLTTGYHRFGTLDDKHYATVSVRMTGQGTIETSKVLDDGTVTSLGVTDASEGEVEIPLGLTGPAERLALRFDLLREATDSTRGPTLLGYQLKALPLPKRQRMKRVPLMLFDREQNRVGQEMGNDGSAWTRLQALEALEEANAVVDFEDKETGETGSAYIESVEMRRTAPTSRHGDGFGGTIWLTLRVI